MATSVADIRKDYPLPAYRFNVNFNGEDIAFSDVSGLEIAREAITYRDGLGVKYMPGKEGEVRLTLKRGVVRSSDKFYVWINSVRLNAVDKKNIAISLLDDEDKPVVTWNVQNAFPVKLSAPSFDATSNNVAVESLELMADSLRIEYA